MKLNLINPVPERFCAIDASTNNAAIAIFNNGVIESTFKITFSGKDVYEKIFSATNNTYNYLKDLNLQYAVIERAVYINSPKTMSELSMVQGALLAGCSLAGIKTFKGINPIAWQTFIGNGKLSKEAKQEIREKNPNKSASWYKAFERDLRKSKTIGFVKVNYDIQTEDNDIADAIGVGHYAMHNWHRMEG